MKLTTGALQGTLPAMRELAEEPHDGIAHSPLQQGRKQTGAQTGASEAGTSMLSHAHAHGQATAPILFRGGGGSAFHEAGSSVALAPSAASPHASNHSPWPARQLPLTVAVPPSSVAASSTSASPRGGSIGAAQTMLAILARAEGGTGMDEEDLRALLKVTTTQLLLYLLSPNDALHSQVRTCHPCVATAPGLIQPCLPWFKLPELVHAPEQ